MIWMICQDKDGGKFYDGFYGWDANIHSQEQIFSRKDIPFKLNPNMRMLVVGMGRNKPSVNEVNRLLRRL
jgi:hypothetical protein